MSFRPGTNERRPGTGIGWRVISSIVSDDSDERPEGLSWIKVDPRVTLRCTSFLQECLSLSVRPDVGATNEIKTLASLPILSLYELNIKLKIAVSVKIYVEKGSILG